MPSMDSIFNTCGARQGVTVPSPNVRLLQEEVKLEMCCGRNGTEALTSASGKSGCPGWPRQAGGNTPRLRKLDSSGRILEIQMRPQQAFIESRRMGRSWKLIWTFEPSAYIFWSVIHTLWKQLVMVTTRGSAHSVNNIPTTVFLA